MGCSVIAALLQYFFLAMFCIMLALGIDLAIAVLDVFSSRSSSGLLLLLGWGICLLHCYYKFDKVCNKLDDLKFGLCIIWDMFWKIDILYNIFTNRPACCDCWNNPTVNKRRWLWRWNIVSRILCSDIFTKLLKHNVLQYTSTNNLSYFFSDLQLLVEKWYTFWIYWSSLGNNLGKIIFDTIRDFIYFLLCHYAIYRKRNNIRQIKNNQKNPLLSSCYVYLPNSN